MHNIFIEIYWILNPVMLIQSEQSDVQLQTAIVSPSSSATPCL